MAEEVRRWTVTYTKHVKQKRKVYQDGYLLLVSKKKVILYDDCDKLLESKFLKEDENLSPGKTLTFGSYLVDIGDSGNADLAQEEKPEKCSALDSNCTPGRQINSAINISSSRRIIRDFKKNEKIKYALKERSPSSTTSIAGEWQALYTTHLTQKAKKYHDGFIKLFLCGSQGRKATLYDESMDHLSTKFLKKDEVMSSGGTLKFDGYLVDIGDAVNNEKLENVNVGAGEQTCNPSEKHKAVGRKRFQLSSSKNDVVSSLKSRNFAQSYVTAHQLFKSGKPVEQGMNSCGDDVDKGRKSETSSPNFSLHCGSPPHETSSGKDVEPRPKSFGFDAGRVRLTESTAPNMSFSGRVRLTESTAPNMSFRGNPPHEASSRKDVEPRRNPYGIDADRVRLMTESSTPNMSIRGAHEILSFLRKPTPPSKTYITEQAPKQPFYPSPELVILDTDYKERIEGSVQQESEVKLAQYEGLTQTNCNSEEGANPRVIPDILCEIKIEKDSDDDKSGQLNSSSAPNFPRNIEKPTRSHQGLDKLATTNATHNAHPVIKSLPLVDPEKSQPDKLASFRGTSAPTGNHFTANIQPGDAHQHHKPYKADPKCSEVGEKQRSVKCAIGHRLNKIQPAKIRNSSATFDECPKFDLGF